MKKKPKTEHKQNWRETTATVDDIKAFLMDHVYLRHNVVTGRAFTELGFELKHTMNGNCYRVVQRSAEEIRSLLRTVPCDV